MRPHLIVSLCTTVAACGFVSQAFGQTASPLEFTLDLMAPCSATTCTGTHPTDGGFQVQANSFSYTSPSSSYGVAALGLNAPVACDEIAASGTAGATGATRLAPHFANTTLSGGALDFNAGGDSIVDLNSLSFDGSNPAGVSTLYSNYATPSLPAQVTCYQIGIVGSSAANYASGPKGIFRATFEDHVAGEPWVSVQTVNSPNSSAASAPAGGPSSPTPVNTMAYVVQIHNASSATNWRLTLGYDHQYFSSAVSGTAPWACVLGSGIPQPGATSGNCSSISLPYTLKATDVQSATNSIYIYVDNTGSSFASTKWPTLTTAFYPALAAVFPPFGTYPQRLDDKVAVASGNNLPTQNIGAITCNNNKTATACTLTGVDGGTVPAQVTFRNTVNSSGLVNVDPLAYFVSPYGGHTLPSTADTLNSASVSNVSCSDPNGILASPLTATSFATSAGTVNGATATGALQLAFTFKAAGLLYVSGTASCTATVAASAHAPALSAPVSFTITMLPAQATHLSVSAPAGTTAGSAFNSLLVMAKDAAENTVATYSGTVHFSSTDGFAVLPANTILSGGTGTFGATLKSAGTQTISVVDAAAPSISGTSGSINVDPAPATHYVVAAPSAVNAGAPFNISVTAKDAFNNTDTNYGGLVHFTSTDNSAVLPADMALTFGVATPSVTLNAMGTSATIATTDTASASISGSSGSITIN
jgi:hypothetical protein